MANEQLNFCPDCGQELPMFGETPTTAPAPPPVAAVPTVAVDDGVAPDHITMGDYAGFWIRFGAYSIDMLASGVVQAPFFMLSGVSLQATTGPEMALGGLAMVFIAQIVFWYFNSVYLQSTYGWTIGKKLCGLVVLRADGDYMHIGDALVRGLFKAWISRAICALGCIMAAFDADKQSWHDKVAGTYVYYD